MQVRVLLPAPINKQGDCDMWKMNEVNREDAVATLQKQLDILIKDRDQSLILFKMGVLSLDAKIKSLSK